jgi:hypothetical protein
MISAARLAANGANARKSTGPKTAAGKLRIARNGANSKGPRTAAGKMRSAQNARKSTGPISAAGKKRSAQNARRHGLSHCARNVPEFARAVAELGHAFAGESTDPQVLVLAMAAAAAQIDLMRARRARVDLLAAHPFDNIRRAAAIERYEAFARKQRKLAIGALAAATSPSRREEIAERTEPNLLRETILQNKLNQTHCAGDFCKTNLTKPNEGD